MVVIPLNQHYRELGKIQVNFITTYYKGVQKPFLTRNQPTWFGKSMALFYGTIRSSKTTQSTMVLSCSIGDEVKEDENNTRLYITQTLGLSKSWRKELGIYNKFGCQITVVLDEVY